MNDVREAAAAPRRKNPAVLIYLAVWAGAVVCILALTVVGILSAMPLMPNPPLRTLRVIGLALLVAGFIGVGMLSGGILPCRADDDEMKWWRANSVRAVTTWAAAEGIAVLGAVFWLLTGDMVLYAGFVGGGLVLLMLNRPGRMMEG